VGEGQSVCAQRVNEKFYRKSGLIIYQAWKNILEGKTEADWQQFAFSL
jgi:hypothetical protein